MCDIITPEEFRDKKSDDPMMGESSVDESYRRAITEVEYVSRMVHRYAIQLSVLGLTAPTRKHLERMLSSYMDDLVKEMNRLKAVGIEEGNKND